ncbi:hypothetical protein CYQ88_05585 [Hydrogenovibrio sp. SC-1]|uniref:MAPEG family protein n=1 Tax=Hydrogenovibrio sp. SC-1 TaxID=2065820 RepID=UPI000C7D4E33|nr:MAPEG family protein [Hydrogenovibrio sp. SC-1]PLA74552.1 hypothetical protein CYQ88_05585 [Hydrogenovibrio sp. SC-1]
MSAVFTQLFSQKIAQPLIFFPLLLLVFLTFYVGVRMLFLRVKAVKQDGLVPQYFQFNRGAKLPPYLIQCEQHYQNLFELPVLFYLLVITLFVTQQVTVWQLFLSCVFVVTRFWHAWEHLGSNFLIRRRNAFLIGSLVLIVGWVSFALAMIQNFIVL